jgi:hypothetical protein
MHIHACAIHTSSAASTMATAANVQTATVHARSNFKSWNAGELANSAVDSSKSWELACPIPSTAVNALGSCQERVFGATRYPAPGCGGDGCGQGNEARMTDAA